MIVFPLSGKSDFLPPAPYTTVCLPLSSDVLVGEEITVHEETTDVIRNIFEYYLAGASLGKIVDMLLQRAFPLRQETQNGLGQL